MGHTSMGVELIDEMKEVRTFQLDESVDENDDEMDMSDDDSFGLSSKRARIEKPKRKDEMSPQSHDIKSEDGPDAELKNKQIKVLQETIRNLQRKLIETNTKEKHNETRITELEESIRESNVKELLLRTKIASARSISQSVINDDASETSSIAPNNSLEANSNEPQLISLATAYLVIHPTGADLRALVSYASQFMPATSESEMHDVLARNEKLFSTNDAEKWFFVGFTKGCHQ